FLTTAQLNEALGLQPGDPYGAHTLEACLASRENQRDITSRYLNNGYLFFRIDSVAKARPGGGTDLTFNLAEGPTARINAVTIRGNHRVATPNILPLITLHPGELFSRARLIESQRALAGSGWFVPTNIGVNPQPVPDKGLVNIEFVVVEK
ncbi:MAG: outer membrane protein assembly factor BamA, partial [Hymenobacter sp.]